jgi:hypothetical protein
LCTRGRVVNINFYFSAFRTVVLIQYLQPSNAVELKVALGKQKALRIVSKNLTPCIKSRTVNPVCICNNFHKITDLSCLASLVFGAYLAWLIALFFFAIKQGLANILFAY